MSLCDVQDSQHQAGVRARVDVTFVRGHGDGGGEGGDLAEDGRHDGHGPGEGRGDPHGGHRQVSELDLESIGSSLDV